MKRLRLTLLNLVMALTLLLPPAAPILAASAPPPPRTLAKSPPRQSNYSPLFSYRTTVLLRHPQDAARLADLGIQILDLRASSATVLADADQLATLGRLGFEPQDTEELGSLAAALVVEKPLLAASVRPLLTQGMLIQQRIEIEGAARLKDLDSLQAAVRGLSPEIRLALASFPSTDDDGDGLTNTEESWWCTDPEDPDSDHDTLSDGAEVRALRDWLANRRPKAPDSGPPFKGWPMVPGDSNYSPACIDRDQDAVPDAAELAIGLNPNRESTPRDKFDDGQKLYGLTKVGYGALPRPVDGAVIFAEMPSWVKFPGNHPLVAAFPIPEIDVVENSLHVQAVTTITVSSDQTITNGTERSYSTSETKGVSDSVADTVTWNEWQEVSTTTPIGQRISQPADDLGAQFAAKTGGTKTDITGAELHANGTVQVCGSAAGAGALAGGGAAAAGCANVNNTVNGSVNLSLISVDLGGLCFFCKKPDEAQTNLRCLDIRAQETASEWCTATS